MNNNSQENSKSFYYKLLNESSTQIKEICRAIAFNHDSSILFAACENIIKVYSFRFERIKLIQQIPLQSQSISSIIYISKSHEVVSSSRNDKAITLYSAISMNRFSRIMKMTYNNLQCVSCLIANKQDNMLVQGNYQGDIVFWAKQIHWKQIQSLKEHKKTVFSLSLNDQSQELISCGLDKFILIARKDEQNQKWICLQKVIIQKIGVRLAYINNDYFTFQPLCHHKMDVYRRDVVTNIYIKEQSVIVKQENISSDSCWYNFPQQYIQQKELLINKNSKYVQIIKHQINGEFNIEQTIEYPKEQIFGSVNGDGSYLAIWDYGSKALQIRKYQLVENSDKNL